MGWKEFVASLVASLAWPLTIVVMVWLLRERLRTALERLLENRAVKHLRFGQFEATLEEVERSLDQGGAPPADDPATKNVTMLPSMPATVTDGGVFGEASAVTEASLHELAESSPAAAVVAAWRGVEYELRNLARRRGGSAGIGPLGPRALAHHLKARGVLSPEAYLAVRKLLTLRGEAVYGQGAIPVEDAKEYATQARRLVALLRAPEAQS